MLAKAGRQLVIDLAGQKPQRQANNPRAIGAHALNGIMGFACVGGAEHGHNPFQILSRQECFFLCELQWLEKARFA